MTPELILNHLWEGGVSLRLTSDGQNLSVPAGRLSTEQRALVVAHKTELVTFLHDAHITTAALIEAAMRCCDQWGDCDGARADMRRDCMETPAHLQADLLNHFKKSYPQNS